MVAAVRWIQDSVMPQLERIGHAAAPPVLRVALALPFFRSGLTRWDSFLSLSAGTVYPLLARLKADGLVESEWVDVDLVHPRKYYSLTPAGRHRAIEMAEVWVRFSAGIGGLLSPVLKEDIA